MPFLPITPLQGSLSFPTWALKSPSRMKEFPEETVPNPKAQGCDPFYHWGKPQHETAELGGNKQTHLSSPPLPEGHSRAEESPIFAPVPHGSPCRLWAYWGMVSHLLFGLGLVGYHEEQPGHQALSDKSRPRPGSRLGPQLCTSRASILWSS
ncbi:hypothetical protein AMECASPLE_015041 [Ameca splendens]|uniref:Uncharacterized protein n=1 Tax=Ameca splendens TaxID=208324 RepID=A0ABV1A854_9TELE